MPQTRSLKRSKYTLGYYISQSLLDYTLGEDGHQVEEIYNFPSSYRSENRSSEHDTGLVFERLQLKASMDLGHKFGLYSTYL